VLDNKTIFATAWLSMLGISFCRAESKCPDLSGKYSRQYEDGVGIYDIVQHECDTLTITDGGGNTVVIKVNGLSTRYKSGVMAKDPTTVSGHFVKNFFEYIEKYEDEGRQVHRLSLDIHGDLLVSTQLYRPNGAMLYDHSVVFNRALDHPSPPPSPLKGEGNLGGR